MTTGGIAYANEPVKGPTSHVVESFQYLALHVAHLATGEDVGTVPAVQVRKRRGM